MKKKVLVICCLVLVFALLFSGCNTGEPGAAESATQEQSAVQEDAAEDTQGDAAEDTQEDAAETMQTSGFKVGFANAYVGNTWRDQYIASVTAQFEKYKAEGIIAEYQVANSDNNVNDQMNQINSMINSGFDAIIIDPASATALTSVIESATSKGILIIIDNDVAPYPNTISIGQDIANLATIIAKVTAIEMGGQGNYVYISGLAGNPTDTVRTDALNAVMEDYPDIVQLATAPGSWSDTEAQSVMSTFLQTYGDKIDAVVAQDYMSAGMLQAYANAGMVPKIMTGTYTKGFVASWVGEYRTQFPGLKMVAVPSVADCGAWGVDLAVGLLQGRTINEDILVGNPLDPSVKDMIMIPVPYCIVDEEAQSQEFLDFMAAEFPTTAIYTPEEALAQAEDAKDGDVVMGYLLTDDDLNKIFKD